MLGGAAHDNPSQWGFCGELATILTPGELCLSLGLAAVSSYEENGGQVLFVWEIGC